MFTVNHLTFRFTPTASSFFHMVDFTIDRPGITFITGKNGVGKTTLFNILLNRVSPSACVKGQIHTPTATYALADSSQREAFANTTALVHQHVNKMLADEFTGEQNLQFSRFATKPGLQSLPEITDLRIFAERFGIPIYRPVHNLSGGQRQLLAIVMALHKSVDLLLLDEPTAALDDANSHRVMTVVRELALERNIPVLCISHDKELVDQYTNGLILHLEATQAERIIHEQRL